MQCNKIIFARLFHLSDRDNARRTRKRKKLYVTFLNNAIEALEVALQSEGEILEDCDDIIAKRGRGRPRKADAPPPRPALKPRDSNSASTENRVEVIAQFLRQLYSSEGNGSFKW